jgi:hypothetical protein
MRLGGQISVELTNPRRYSIKKGESRFKKRGNSPLILEEEHTMRTRTKNRRTAAPVIEEIERSEICHAGRMKSELKSKRASRSA